MVLLRLVRPREDARPGRTGCGTEGEKPRVIDPPAQRGGGFGEGLLPRFVSEGAWSGRPGVRPVPNGSVGAQMGCERRRTILGMYPGILGMMSSTASFDARRRVPSGPCRMVRWASTPPGGPGVCTLIPHP